MFLEVWCTCHIYHSVFRVLKREKYCLNELILFIKRHLIGSLVNSDIWGSCRGVSENTGTCLLGYEAVKLCVYILTFRRYYAPPKCLEILAHWHSIISRKALTFSHSVIAPLTTVLNTAQYWLSENCYPNYTERQLKKLIVVRRKFVWSPEVC